MRRVLLMRGVLLIRGAAAYENPENETLLISDERIATYLPIGFLLGGGLGARGLLIRGYGYIYIYICTLVQLALRGYPA